MGTEGRRGGMSDIKPQEKIYSTVVFKSPDIKDLKVLSEAPKSRPKATEEFFDPAILSASPMRSGEEEEYNNDVPRGFESIKPSQIKPSQKSLHFGSLTSTDTGRESMSESVFKTRIPTKSVMTDSHSSPMAKHPLATSNVTKSPVMFKSSTMQAVQEKSAPLIDLESSSSRAIPSLKPSILETVSMNEKATAASSNDKVMAYSTGTGRVQMVPKEIRSYASVVSDGAGRFKPLPSTIQRTVPKSSEFDFTSSNSRMNFEDAHKKILSNSMESSTFYNPKKSFFDSISTDLSTENEPSLKNEKRWNIETFGIAIPPSSNHHMGGASSMGRKFNDHPNYNSRYSGNNRVPRSGYSNVQQPRSHTETTSVRHLRPQ